MSYVEKHLSVIGQLHQWTEAITNSITFSPTRETETGKCHVQVKETVPGEAVSFTTQIFGSAVPIPTAGTGTALTTAVAADKLHLDVPQLPYMRIDLIVTVEGTEGVNTFDFYLVEP